jgi:CDP-glucose 4,6-dehydratase
VTASSRRVDGTFWLGRRVLLTGHTGFKGAWLATWLQQLGAEVTGLANGIPTTPSLYDLAGVRGGMACEVTEDVRDFPAVAVAFADARPEVVFHMAAQSLVRRSLVHPRETYETNVLGTVNVLDAIRSSNECRVVVNVTSDKCYETRERGQAYREDEAMGGNDPYSSSKGCAELVTTAFRRSFFESADAPRIASARAGNVIGGGDWSDDRLIPDLMRAALGGMPLRVRNPGAVRPWQHVLNPLSGYLILAQALWESAEYATPWNFGPADDEAEPVGWLVDRIQQRWHTDLRWDLETEPQPNEAQYLRVDSSKARTELGWQPTWDLDEAIDRTVSWYQGFEAGANVREITRAQITSYTESATRADSGPAIGHRSGIDAP